MDRTHQIIHPKSIPDMEAALATRGIPVAELCRRAEVAETTWGRWKRGKVSPTFKTWDAVSAAYLDLVSPEGTKGAA